MKFEVSGMAAALPEERADLGAHVKEMRTLLDGAMESALRIASYSRPALLDTLGLVAALNSEARRFQARTGIQCEVTSNSTHLDLNRETLTVIFRIIQEALSNVARHAQATRVTIGLEKLADGLLLTVEDNGLGIPDRAIGDPKSLGLLGMRESTLLLGGTMLITGTPGKGTRVSVTIPFKGSGGHPLGDTKSV
jgi:signal transduction histidine kinase